MKESKEDELYQALSDIDEGLIDEAQKTPLKKRKKYSVIKKLCCVAACVAVLITAYFILPIKDSITGKQDGQLSSVTFPKAYAFDDVDARINAFESFPVEDGFIDSVNNFSYKTSSKLLSEKNENITYSPISLYYALAMATTGAENDTADELSNLLGEKDNSVLSKQCANLFNQLYFDNNVGKLRIANSLWMDKTVEFKKDYVDNCATNFFAESFKVDFSKDKTGEEMSKWISKNTNGTLNPTFKTNSDGLLSLINTVYFKDQWADKFDKNKTSKDLFIIGDGETVSCDFMNNKLDGSFSKGKNYTRAELSLKNGGEMIFILPDDGVMPSELLNTPEKAKEVFDNSNEQNGEVTWKIPKFTFDTKMNLKDMLKSEGINKAFSGIADFSNITDTKSFISSVNQETHIAVDELGAEASAFTKVAISKSAMPSGEAKMLLDRPFIYGIKKNDVLIFTGVVNNPSEK